MRRLIKFGPLLGLAVMLASLAAVLAQGFGGRGFGVQFLVRNKSVQKELKLSDDQVKKIDEAVARIDAKHTEEFKTAKNIEDKKERFEKFGEIQKTVSEEVMKDLGDILSADQTKRLKEIEVQVRGPRVFQNAELQKDLNLTDDQKDKIKTILEDTDKDLQDVRQSNQGNFEEIAKKTRAINKESLEKIVAVLTPDQKKAWKEKTGEPFEIQFDFSQFKGKGKFKKKADQ
jgi:Spy/CpxP family protein refolding chaperone